MLPFVRLDMAAKQFQNSLYAMLDALACGVDNQVFALPRPVIARQYLLPCRQSQSPNVASTRFNASTMFVHIGALDLNFERWDVRSVGDGHPGIAT